MKKKQKPVHFSFIFLVLTACSNAIQPGQDQDTEEYLGRGRYSIVLWNHWGYYRPVIHEELIGKPIARITQS